MSTPNLNEAYALIAEKLEQVPNRDTLLNDPAFRATIKEVATAIIEDPETARKMRFGSSEGAHQLDGSKFARHGLSVADVEFMYDWLNAAQGQGRGDNRSTGPSADLKNAFQEISGALYIDEQTIREMDQKALDNVFPRIPKTVFKGRDAILAAQGRYQDMRAYQDAVRAMDTAESGYGSQLIGAQYVSDLWAGARAESRIFGRINTFEMTDPTAYLPVEADIPEMLFVAENTANNSSNYSTSKTGSNRVTVTAKKFLIHQMWSGELQEDSILPFVPFLRRQVVLSLAHYTDSAVLNGDTTNAATGNINLDDADPADTKHYLAFDGIRHASLVDNTATGINVSGPIAFSHLMLAKEKMIDDTYLFNWGDPTQNDDLIYVADPRTAARIAQLDEVMNAKLWGGVPLLTNFEGVAGMAFNIMGHPGISSMAMSLTEADGKVSDTGANNTLGQVAVFNRRAFVGGWRRRVQVASEYLPATDQFRMVHSMRLGLGRYSPTGAASGIYAASVLRNIDLS